MFAFPAVLTKQLSIAAVSMKIATSVDKFVSKQQKTLFLRQQLAAINVELQRFEPASTDVHGGGNITEDEDDLDILVRRVDALPTGTEVRRVASTEARRLRRIHPRNAEHSVVRNYVHTSVFFPYPRIVSDTTLSSNGSLLSLGHHQHLARIPLRGPTCSPNVESQLDVDHFSLDEVK